MLIDLATENTFLLFEISIILSALIIIITIFTNFEIVKEVTFHLFRPEIKNVVICGIIYLIIDLINSIYAPNVNLVWQKYKVIASTIIIQLVILISCNSNSNYSYVKWPYIYASLYVSIFTLLDYVFFNSNSTHYILRLSLRSDYNIFATVLFVGYVFSIFYTLNGNFNFVTEILQICVVSMIIVPIILLSGSRRILIFTIITLIIFCMMYIYSLCKNSNNNMCKMLILFLLVIITIFSIKTEIVGIQNYMCYLYDTPESKYAPTIIKSSETSAIERLHSIKNIGAFKKRLIIWKIAINNYRKFSVSEKIFGRGNSYDITMYDNNFNYELSEAYGGSENYSGAMSAHSFLLADLLNGGIIKLISVLLFVISIGKMLILKLIYKFNETVPYVIIMALLIGSNLISNRFGLLYDKIFMTILVMICNIDDRTVVK